MRKLLDEKYIFYKMSNIKLKESNKFFSKAENRLPGAAERASGNSRGPGVSGVQKRRDKCEEKHKGSIDNNAKSVKTNQNVSKSKNKPHSMQRNTDTGCACNFPDYPYAFYQQYYSSICTRRQQMFSSHLLSNGFNLSPCYVVNPFCRSLSESAVPYQQLSNMCFNSYEDQNGVARTQNAKPSSSNTVVNNTRTWQFTTLGKTLRKINGGRNPGVTFKVMTYNVLAQDLLVDHPHLYRENNVQMLDWEIRWKNIYQDIKEHDCEIVCLQEVQQDHLRKYYSNLERLGYRGIYKQRTGIRTDGCAIYYKSSLFNLIEYTTVEYRQPDISILDRDNVGIVATFAPKDNQSAHFIVATTHLLYNPRRHDVRLAQIQVLLTEIERMAYRHKSESSYVPVILTGDLNAEPESPIYNFIARSVLKYEKTVLRTNYIAGKALIPPKLMITDNCQHAGLLKFRSGNQPTLARLEENKYIQISPSGKKPGEFNNSTESSQYKFSSGTLTHNFVFKSVYKHGATSDPEGTTYQNAWITVDYIFYSGTLDGAKNFRDGKLKLLSRFTLPTRTQLSNVRIPNVREGSDHLALLAFFKLEY